MSMFDLFQKKNVDAPLSASPSESDFWRNPFDRLRDKWTTVPLSSLGRARSNELLDLPDNQLLELWQEALREQSEGVGFACRGWYHTLYANSFRGKKVLDVGSGLGFSSLTLARQGAEVTFVDLSPSNIQVLKKLCKLMGIGNTQFVILENLESLSALPADYDVVTAIGSLHHAPASVIRQEVQELITHLRVGGRWLHFTYPKIRWEREGAVPFCQWGEKTDGSGTPWAEWYDVPKLLELFRPYRMDLVFYYEWHNGDFNWFDLVNRGREEQNTKAA